MKINYKILVFFLRENDIRERVKIEGEFIQPCIGYMLSIGKGKRYFLYFTNLFLILVRERVDVL